MSRVARKIEPTLGDDGDDTRWGCGCCLFLALLGVATLIGLIGEWVSSWR